MSHDNNTNKQIERLAEQFKQRIEIHRSQVEPEQRKEDIRKKLEYYNSVWESNPALYWEEPRAEMLNIIPDTPPEEVYESISHPFFRRMNFISQLSTTRFQRHLGATHSRLSHSYGVTAIGKALLDSIETGDGPDISHAERVAVYIYCYIHDAFHGPFGHSLDSIKEYFSLADPNKKLDKNILYREIESESGKIHTMIKSNYDPETASEILDLLKFFANPTAKQLQEKFSDKYYLSELVDSIVDADRIDYLYRDSRNLDLSDPMDVAPLRLIDGVSTQQVETNQEVKVRTLSWHSEYQDDIEELLQSRRKLYKEYYESADKLAIDEMLSHAVYHFLEYFNIDASKGNHTDSEIMRRISYLTDMGLIHFLHEVGQPFITYELIRDMYRGQFIVPIEDYNLAFPGDDESDNEKSGFDEFNQVVSETDITQPLTPANAANITYAMNEAELSVSERLFIISDPVIDHYHTKVNIEGILRDKILTSDDLSNAWRDVNLKKYGVFEKINEIVDDDIMRYFDYTEVPFIYIYFPTHVEWSKGADGNTQDKHWIKEKEPKRINWHNGKSSVDADLDVPLREEFESKRVVLCGPQPFSTGKTKENICRIFEDMIENPKMWLEKILHEGE